MFLPRCMECKRGLAIRILSVCLFVCLSVKLVDCDKTEERPVHTRVVGGDLNAHNSTKDHLALFCEKRMVGWGDPFYLKFCVNRPPLEPIFSRYSLLAPSGST